MAKTSPGLFVRQVRQEMSKVTWPTRREIVVSVIMVFIFCAVIGVYFLLLDKVLTWAVSLIFG